MPASVLFRPSITRRFKTALAGALFSLLPQHRTLESVHSGAAANAIATAAAGNSRSAADHGSSTQQVPGAGATVQDQQQSGASTDQQNNSSDSQDQPEPEGHITKQQAKDLFRSVDEILGFVSGDTGLPIEHKIKRNLITREQVEKYVDKRMKDDKDEKRLEQARLVLQKFGLLPAELRLARRVPPSDGRAGRRVLRSRAPRA